MIEYLFCSPLSGNDGSDHIWVTHLSHNPFKPRLEPLNTIVPSHNMRLPNLRLRPSSPRNPRPRPSHTTIKVHTIDTDRRVVFDAQVDVFTDAEAEVPRLGEVLLAQFVFFDLEAAFEDFFGFGPADGDVHGDLFVATDAEAADCVASFACTITCISTIFPPRRLEPHN
jgi:hypothetical protein